MRKRPDDYYSILGLQRSASQEDIRRAYLLAAKRFHPDTNARPGETQIFLDVHEAYKVLSNDAKRSEYDQNLLPEEDIPSLVNHRIQISRRSLLHINEPQLLYLLLDLALNQEQIIEASSLPLNVCLVLDCSTSMKGEKLETVKTTAIELIRTLKHSDIFSMVTFNDRAEVVIPAIRHVNAPKMESCIRSLKTAGGTEIFKGLQAGFDEVKQYIKSQSTNHIIILTDGQTYGDEQACLVSAKEAANLGIGISSLGIGNSWNDKLLDQLSNITGGHCMLVSQINDIENFLKEKFVNLSNIVVDNVRFDYKLHEGVEINYAFRLQPETDPIIVEKPLRLGPIIKTWPLQILLELVVNPQKFEEESINLLQGVLEFSSSRSGDPLPLLPVNIVLPVEEFAELDLPPRSIVEALSKLTLYRMQEKARHQMNIGNFEKATELLKRLTTHLLAQGEQSLAKTVITEIQSIELEKKFTESGEKRIKYGTRALLLLEEIKP